MLASTDNGSAGSVRILIVASAVSNFGDGMALVAFPWVASLVTREPFLIGLVGTALQLAWIGGPLVVGPLVDRYPRLPLIRASLLVQSAVAALLGVAVVIGIDLELWDLAGDGAVVAVAALVIGVLVLGIAEVVRDLGSQAVLPEIAASDDLDRANSRLMTAELVAGRFAGQPLGGLLLAVGAGIPVMLDALTFLASALVLTRIKSSQSRSEPTPTTRRVTLTEALDGFRWLLRVPILRSMTLALSWSNLMSGIALSTLVLYSQEVLDAGPVEYGLLVTLGAGGGIVGGVIGPRLLKRLGPGIVTIGCIGALAGAYAVMLLIRTPLGMGLALAILSGAALPWSVASRSLRQRITPPTYLGRVSGAHRTLNFGAIPIGTAIGGFIASVSSRTMPLEEALKVPIVVAVIGMTLLIPVGGRAFGQGSLWRATSG